MAGVGRRDEQAGGRAGAAAASGVTGDLSATAGTAATPRDAANASNASDAWLAAQLFAVDPGLIGGIVLRAAAGPVRDRWLADLRAILPESGPWRTVPLHADDDRLLGGIDLAATLQLGRPVALRGLLAEADGGVLLMSMAERASEATIAHVGAAIDAGAVVCARHGVETRLPARFGVVALDEGVVDDERVGAALLDRLAFPVDLRGVAWNDVEQLPPSPTRNGVAAATARLPAVNMDDEVVDALCAAAFALGVDSTRASLQVVRVARLTAALRGDIAVTGEDASLAARLVLGPRATRLPAAAAEETDSPEDERPPDQPDREDAAPDAEGDDDTTAETDIDNGTDKDADQSPPPADDRPLDEVVLAAAAAAIPAGLLERLRPGAAAPPRGASGRAGGLRASLHRGRPIGVRRERPRGGARLDVIATLRAAAPWQRVRGRAPAGGEGSGLSRIQVRSEDFHVSRFQQRARTTTIFAVDASGSAALHRLAEAKGAVELLLADCYVRRDSVAVFAFRGRAAQLLLAPTRSLTRAKRSLAELAGGGGTPLAAGIDAARELAIEIRRRGDTPVIVVLSDGRANIGRDGNPGRERAEADARAAARSLSADGVAALFIDTSPQPHPLAREIAAAMRASYVPLPHAEAAALSAAVRGASAPREPRR